MIPIFSNLRCRSIHHHLVFIIPHSCFICFDNLRTSARAVPLFRDFAQFDVGSARKLLINTLKESQGSSGVRSEAKHGLQLSFKNRIAKCDLIIWILGKKSNPSRAVFTDKLLLRRKKIGSVQIIDGLERFSSMISKCLDFTNTLTLFEK